MQLRTKSLFVITIVLTLPALESSVAIAQHGMAGGTPMTFFRHQRAYRRRR